VHGGDGFGVQVAQFLGKPVAERCLLRRKAGGVEFWPRAGEFGERAEFVGVVPDEAEIVADLVDEAGRRRAAAAVLQGGEIGRGDGEGVGHVALEDFFGGAEGAEFFAEGGHEGEESSAFLKKSAQKTFGPGGAGTGIAFNRL